MRIQIDHDDHVRGSRNRSQEIEATVHGALDRFGDNITLVQVHLRDENGPRFSADDKRCLMEARVAHHPPIAVSHRAINLQQAVMGAANKLERSINHALDRARSH
ncbi:MAG: HPF/RaiA family ribosome-associated protein [Polyangiaceae bacterium]